ncbi:MAG TPA: hypothetical protein VNO75_01035 [Gemmatimonadaceae bacterium]|nr:hypothetical protein [Gemmatimonadaceae bacterium]
MKRFLSSVALIASITACEASTDPIDGIGGGGPGGGAVTPAQISGNWSFALDRTTATCPAGSLPDNQVILADLDVLTTGLMTGTSTWQASPGPDRSLEGGLNLATGVGSLILRGSAAGTAMELEGTFTADGDFDGTLRDPRAGSLPVFSSGSCQYNATGDKA